MKSNRLKVTGGLPFAALASLLALSVNAQEEGDSIVETLDLTIELLPPGATLPESVTRTIELPAAVAEAARENAARGLETANAAREGREQGLAIAEQAQEQGRERAQQVLEDLGRGPPGSDGPPGPPDLPVDPPVDLPGPNPGNVPENPGPPGN